MNYIYWHTDRIGALTNLISAENHSHWMLQLFLSLDGLIEIDVAGKKLNGSCIIVGKNISHSIDTKQKTIFTMLIAPTSTIAAAIEPHINSCGYWICDTGNLTSVQTEAQKLVLSNSIEQYFIFLQKLNEHLNIRTETILLFKEKQLLLIMAYLRRRMNSFCSISRRCVSSNVFYTRISDDIL